MGGALRGSVPLSFGPRSASKRERNTRQCRPSAAIASHSWPRPGQVCISFEVLCNSFDGSKECSVWLPISGIAEPQFPGWRSKKRALELHGNGLAAGGREDGRKRTSNNRAAPRLHLARLRALSLRHSL